MNFGSLCKRSIGSNAILSWTFCVCAIIALPHFATRCEDAESQYGAQRVAAAEDCNSLIQVDCIDTCGKIYGDRILRTDVTVPVYEHIRRCGDEQWGYVDSDVVCQSPYSPLRYFASVTCANMAGSYTRLVSYPSKAECNNQCSQYATAWAPGYSATAVDCSCKTLPQCTCESATSSASSRRVTDSASCRVYFRSKDGVWADSLPISRCEGRLKKVTDCVDFTSWM